jgi:hypothetical protein
MDAVTYIKDILQILPENSNIIIYTTDNELNFKLPNIVLDILEKDRKFQMKNNLENRTTFFLSINAHNIIDRIEIKQNNELLFEGYDGMEFGTISKKTTLPVFFIENYIKGDMCMISKDW